MKSREWLLFGSMIALSGPAAAANVPSAVRSLRIEPQDRTLWAAGVSQHLLVLATYADGLERDVTSQSKFVASDPKVLDLAEVGRAVAVSDGQTTITANFGGLSAKAAFRVTGSKERRPFAFAQDVGAILTKNGCNDSICHGGVKGKGGFKLSLNALYPREDYKWIVEGGTYQVLTADEGKKVPRIDKNDPAKSLLLLKPTMSTPHGGGLRFRKDSADYQAILNWVQQGAPYGEEGKAGSVDVVRVEVFPQEVVLDPRGKHRLLVTAYFSNGRQEDLTDQVRYVSNNPEVVKVSASGEVEAVRAGETAILIRAAGHAVSAVIGVTAKPIPDYPDVTRNNFIDDYVFAKLRRFNIVPSALSSDAEFLRRVCLDLTGTLPPPNRVREFLASNDVNKRKKLIDILLDSQEYVDYWTFRFSDLFRVGFFQNGFNVRWTEAYWRWIRDNIASNKPYDQVARERLIAVGTSPESRHYLPNGDVGHPENHMAEEVRVFLGRRLDCAQCHNHPFESWSQDQFWGMTAFFGRMDLVGGRGEEFGTIIYESPNGEDVTIGRSGKVVNPRTKVEVKPAFLDGSLLSEEDLPHLRTKLADWVIAHPYFAEAAANRIWGYFFEKGIVDPVDDFRSTNAPSNPQLLKALADDFRTNGYNLKHLIRRIVNSRTYQLASAPNETNKDDLINYSHAVPRALDAEVLFDAISQVTGIPDLFIQDRDRPGILPPGTRAINVSMPDVYQSRVLAVFGRSLRFTVPERKTKPNLAQALDMLAGPSFTDKVSKDGGRIDQLLQRGAIDKEIVEELYLLALSRFPTEREQSDVSRLIVQQPSRREALQDLLWGLIASREFSENH